MKIQYISDLHLEFLKPKKIHTIVSNLVQSAPDESYLALCGDLSPNKNVRHEFLTKLSESGKWKQIWFVPGNHDYWLNKSAKKNKYRHRLGIAETLESKHDDILYHNSIPNVVVFDKTKIEVEDVVVLGCTLWTYPDSSMDLIMNDYKKIPGWSIEQCRMTHCDNRNWLWETLDTLEGRKVVILSHHLPSFDAIPEFKRTDCAISAIASDCDDMCRYAMFWICGHCHSSQAVKIFDCQVVMNCLGYPDEKINNFNYNKYITL